MVLLGDGAADVASRPAGRSSGDDGRDAVAIAPVTTAAPSTPTAGTRQPRPAAPSQPHSKRPKMPVPVSGSLPQPRSTTSTDVVLVQQDRVVGVAAGIAVGPPLPCGERDPVQISRSKITVATASRSACATAYRACCQPSRRFVADTGRKKTSIARPS